MPLFVKVADEAIYLLEGHGRIERNSRCDRCAQLRLKVLVLGTDHLLVKKDLRCTFYNLPAGFSVRLARGTGCRKKSLFCFMKKGCFLSPIYFFAVESIKLLFLST